MKKLVWRDKGEYHGHPRPTLTFKDGSLLWCFYSDKHPGWVVNGTPHTHPIAKKAHGDMCYYTSKEAAKTRLVALAALYPENATPPARTWKWGNLGPYNGHPQPCLWLLGDGGPEDWDRVWVFYDDVSGSWRINASGTHPVALDIATHGGRYGRVRKFKKESTAKAELMLRIMAYDKEA